MRKTGRMSLSTLAWIFALVLPAACNFPRPAPLVPSAIEQPVETPVGATMLATKIAALTAGPTGEPTPTPSPSRASPTAMPSATGTPTATESATPKPENAPTLPPISPDTFPAWPLTNGSRDRRAVALTFDLCQKPEYPAGFDWGIYDTLAAAEAPATFFVGGDWARSHPEETRLLAANPLFELGNHSWSHPDLIDLDQEQIGAQILKTQQILYEFTGEQPRLFRLPAGLYNDQVLKTIARHGLYTIQWDVVTADPVPDNQAENINRIVREGAQNGSIIIMHANGRGWHTAEALPEMIAYLREQGFRLVTVSELLGLEE